MNNPRKPTEEEVEQLVGTLTDQGYDHLDAAYLVEDAGIAVFDEYTADYPAYSGKVMVVVWGSLPACYAVYTWGTDGTIRFEVPDSGRSAFPSRLPEFKDYVVDIRLREFRRVCYDDEANPRMETIRFDSAEGDELLAEYIKTLDPDRSLFKRIAAIFRP